MGVLLATIVAAVLTAAPEPSRTWRDEVVYVIMIDKFANGDPSNDVMLSRYGQDRAKYEGGFWGGDLDGIRGHLDDLAELGVTTLLLYPVVANDERPFGKYLATGYRPRDYDRVDPNFGTVETLRRLIDRSHARGLRVMLDMPLGIPGVENPIYADPKRRDWFGAMSPYGVRQWDASKPEVANYLIGVARDWKARSGCDGFRLDSAHMHADAFWTRFARELQRGSPEFVLLAEYVRPPRAIGPFLRSTGFTSAYDFSFSTLRDVAGQGGDVGMFRFVTAEAQPFYPDPRRLVAQLDTYDVSEFARTARAPVLDRFRLALTVLLTIDRVPLLYSGDERGVAYREVGGLFREPRPNPEFYRDVRALIALRRRVPALRRGDFQVVASAGTLFAFTRTLDDATYLIAFNTGDQARALASPIGGVPWRDLNLTDALGGGRVKRAGSAEPLSIAPITARVLAVERSR